MSKIAGEMTVRRNHYRSLDILRQLLTEKANRRCADCHSRGTRYASWNLGVFLCNGCGIVHKLIALGFSQVQSLNYAVWNLEQVMFLRQMGNRRAAAIYERKLPIGFRRPQRQPDRLAFVIAKYVEKRYMGIPRMPPRPPVPRPHPRASGSGTKQGPRGAECQFRKPPDPIRLPVGYNESLPNVLYVDNEFDLEVGTHVEISSSFQEREIRSQKPPSVASVIVQNVVDGIKDGQRVENKSTLRMALHSGWDQQQKLPNQERTTSSQASNSYAAATAPHDGIDSAAGSSSDETPAENSGTDAVSAGEIRRRQFPRDDLDMCKEVLKRNMNRRLGAQIRAENN